jgi:hypothetical protein
MKKILFALAAVATLSAPAMAQNFSATLSLGTSPIAQAFSVRGVLSYSTTLIENLSLTAQARANFNSANTNTFSFSVRVTPRYTLSLFTDIGLDVTGFAALDVLLNVVPSPVFLIVTPLVGLDVAYALTDDLALYAGLEFDFSVAVSFGSGAIATAPFLSGYLELGYAVLESVTVSLGSNAGTDFAGVFFNPYLNLAYRLTDMITLILEGGFDNGGFLANADGGYIFLRGRFRF